MTEIQNGALIIENNTISEITVFPKLMTVENEQTSGENFMSYGEVTRSLFGKVFIAMEEQVRNYSWWGLNDGVTILYIPVNAVYLYLRPFQ